MLKIFYCRKKKNIHYVCKLFVFYFTGEIYSRGQSGGGPPTGSGPTGGMPPTGPTNSSSKTGSDYSYGAGYGMCAENLSNIRLKYSIPPLS